MSGFDYIHLGDELIEKNKREALERQEFRHVLVAEKHREWQTSISDIMTDMIQDELGIPWVTAEVYQEYELEGWLSNSERDIAKDTIFGDTPLTEVYDCKEQPYHTQATKNNKYLRITTVDGQYSAREDYAKQSLLTVEWFDPEKNLRASKLIIFHWDISDEQVELIKNAISNPLEEKTINIQDNDLLKNIQFPEDIVDIDGFIDSHEDHDQYIQKTKQEYKLAMSQEDLQCVYEYFKEVEKRNPSIAEIKVLDNYRSDHCRHTTFNTEILSVVFAKEKGIFEHIKASQESYLKAKKDIGREGKPNTLMELAQMSARYLQANPHLNPNIKNLTISEENNACSFDTIVEKEDGTTEERHILFKNETHNHPTEIAPYGWAATCVGWCIRDLLAWKNWVFQAMRISWSSDPTEPSSATMAGKLAQRTISTMAALWFASYGNQIGIATSHVREYFHPWFVAKRFEVGYVIWGVPRENVKEMQPKKDDKVILIWWRTGRDAVWAAWWSSKEHDQNSLSSAGTEVQRGNPVEERKIMKALWDPRIARYIKRCNDGWAGGISVMIGELTRGITIDLDKVPLKYQWLDGTEIALAESQERMAIVIDPEHEAYVMSIIETYNLEATHVATVTNDEDHPENDRLTMKWRGKDIVDVSRDFLEQAWAKRTIPEVIIDGKETIDFFNTIPEVISNAKNPSEAFLANLRRKEVASQRWLGNIFDSSVGAGNVLAPYGGKYETTPQLGMIARIPSFNGVNSRTTTISTHGYNPEISNESAYLQAVYAIVLSVSKQVALWWDYSKIWFSLQEYFGKLEQDPERRWHPYSALLGAWEALNQLHLAAIGWKDSMSGTYTTPQKKIHVPDTVVWFAANTGTVNKVISAEFKKPENKIIAFDIPRDENGMIDFAIYTQQLETIQELINKWWVKSSHVVEEWWLAAAIAKMTFGNKIGFDFANELTQDDLYRPLLGNMVLEIDQNAWELDIQGLWAKYIGKTKESVFIWLPGLEQEHLDDVFQAWEETLAGVFPFKSGWWKVDPINITAKAKERESTWLSLLKVQNIVGEALGINILKTKPKIIIPVFPGTNSEMDTAHRIIQAGMDPILFNIQNLTPEKLRASIKQLARLIDQSQGTFRAGWFSAGDEPDGSGKYMASIMRIPELKDVLNKIFGDNSTLHAAVCNGFQALIKTGVFKNGQIEDRLTDTDVTLTHNKNRGHMTWVPTVQVTSVKSPMLEYVNIGDRYRIPISHGEWNLVGDPDTIALMIENGQIFLQYNDINGDPTNIQNGSTQGIAGITNPKANIIWMMPHPERIDGKLFQNIPWNKEFPLFKGMAKWFGVWAYKKEASKLLYQFFTSMEHKQY